MRDGGIDLEEFFANLKRLFDEGKDPGALQVVSCYVSVNRPVPPWARDAFSLACMRGFGGQVRSWDKVFGRPNPVAKLRRIGRDCRAAKAIWDAVADAKMRAVAIDNDFFKAAGARFHLSSTQAKRFYAEACKMQGKPKGP